MSQHRHISTLQPPPPLNPGPLDSSSSPTSTCSDSSVSSSLFDRSHHQLTDLALDDRRRSAGSMSSWESQNPQPDVYKPPDRPSELERHSSSSDSLHSTDHVKTPEQGEVAFFPSVSPPHLVSSFGRANLHNLPNNISPASSDTSTAPSKGDSTPRAEIAPPVWPLATRAHGQEQNAAGKATPRVGESSNTSGLKRDGSWRKKHASLDTPPNSGPFQTFSVNSTSSAWPSSSGKPRSTEPMAPRVSTSPPPPELRRASAEGPLSPLYNSSPSLFAAPRKVVAQSAAMGCEILAPISPPAHYPEIAARRASMGAEHFVPSSSSTALSSSFALPNAPRWARPPKQTSSKSGRARSFGAEDIREKPSKDVDVDFDPELFEGQEGEWIEVLKGNEGRIAIKSTDNFYEILVWLPGFSVDNITMATKRERTIQIVADQWDDADHAQWDIKLGHDADLNAIKAKFERGELRVIVPRHVRTAAKSYRSAFSAISAPAVLSTPDVQGIRTAQETTSAAAAAQAIARARAQVALELPYDRPAPST